MKLCTDIHDPQRMNLTDFGDHLTLPLAPPAGENLNLFMTNIWKTKDIPISLSCTLCLVLFSKC